MATNNPSLSQLFGANTGSRWNMVRYRKNLNLNKMPLELTNECITFLKNQLLSKPKNLRRNKRYDQINSIPIFEKEWIMKQDINDYSWNNYFEIIEKSVKNRNGNGNVILISSKFAMQCAFITIVDKENRDKKGIYFSLYLELLHDIHQYMKGIQIAKNFQIIISSKIKIPKKKIIDDYEFCEFSLYYEFKFD